MTQTVSIKINSQLLANAQSYSKKMGSDLSHFIEILLSQVVPSNDKAENVENAIKPIEKLSPFVQSLCGVVKDSQGVNDLDGDNARLEYLRENV